MASSLSMYSIEIIVGTFDEVVSGCAIIVEKTHLEEMREKLSSLGSTTSAAIERSLRYWQFTNQASVSADSHYSLDYSEQFFSFLFIISTLA